MECRQHRLFFVFFFFFFFFLFVFLLLAPAAVKLVIYIFVSIRCFRPSTAHRVAFIEKPRLVIRTLSPR